MGRYPISPENTLATHWQHTGNTLAPDPDGPVPNLHHGERNDYKVGDSWHDRVVRVDEGDEHVGNSMATHWQHVGNTLAPDTSVSYVSTRAMNAPGNACVGLE